MAEVRSRPRALRLIPLAGFAAAAFACSSAKVAREGEKPCVPSRDIQIAEAILTLKGADARRAAGARIILPQDPSHSDSLNQMAVIAVTAFSRDAKDLPIDRLHVIGDSRGETVLRLSRAVPGAGVRTVDESVSGTLGGFVEEAYFLVPMVRLLEAGSVVVWYAGGRSKLPVLQLPLLPEPGILTAAKRPAPDRVPDLRRVFELILSEPCVPAERPAR